MTVRGEKVEDQKAVHALNETAFETESEANLVDALRRGAQPFISLVAEDNNKIIGHIMFTPVSLSGYPDLKIMGLAPMAVEPEQQRAGVGSKLVEAGLEGCRSLGYGAVIVLGHPTYYPRFGFEPSVKYNIKSEYDAPADAFMAMELEPGYLSGKSGIIKFHTAFNNA